jgi:hypothetical protein
LKPGDLPAEIRAAGLSPEGLQDVVAKAGWGRLDPSTVTVADVDYAFGSPATAALRRVSGRDVDGRSWSLFCKVIQHARHWVRLAMVPAEARDALLNAFPWRQELDLWDPAFRMTMPTELRPPHLYEVVDLGDDRIALWMEDVPSAGAQWDLPRYAAAARALGRWNQRARDPRLLDATGLPSHFPLRAFSQGALRTRGLEPLSNDELWVHPWLRPESDLRQMLRPLAARLADLIDRLDSMALCRPHGDASPQNLLTPIDTPDAFVVIDVSQQAPTALGCDLGQLAVGLIHAEQVLPDMLPDIIATVVPAYCFGLREEGYDGDDASIEVAMWTSMLTRSGFDSLRYDLLAHANPGDRSRTFNTRVELTRHIAVGASAVL